MKTFSELLDPKLEDIRLNVSEASILKPDYVAGQKFQYKGDWKDLNKHGYEKGDIFQIVKPTTKVVDVIGSEDAEHEKFLQGKDGKVVHIKGGVGYRAGSFTHLKASGSPPTGAEWEECIIYAYNELKNQSTDKDVKETAMKFMDLYGDISKVIAKNFSKKISAKQLISTGKGGIPNSISNFYKESGASNKTPKTDIASSSFKEKISLKKAGGSQLASGAKGESIAIVRSALSAMGNEKKFATGLTNLMEQKMSTLISKETVTSLNKRVKDGESDASIIDFQEKDKDNRELSEVLNSYINQDSEINKLFSKHVVFEAATGSRKFNDGPAAANLLGKFDISSFRVDVEPLKDINSPIVQKYASSVSCFCAFKKGGGAGSAYSSMRLGLDESHGITDLRTIVLSELNSDTDFNSLLTEDFLEEGALDMIKRASNWSKQIGSKVWNKFQKIIKNVLKKINVMLSKIARLGERMFEALLSFCGLQIDNVRGIPTEVAL